MAPPTVHPVDHDVEVRVTREMPVLSTALEARIDALWVRAVERVAASGAGQLFNGRVFSVDTITPDRITGHLTEYRRMVAQAEDHALFANLASARWRRAECSAARTAS